MQNTKARLKEIQTQINALREEQYELTKTLANETGADLLKPGGKLQSASWRFHDNIVYGSIELDLVNGFRLTESTIEKIQANDGLTLDEGISLFCYENGIPYILAEKCSGRDTIGRIKAMFGFIDKYGLIVDLTETLEIMRKTIQSHHNIIEELEATRELLANR